MLRDMSESIQDRVLRVIATTKRVPLETVTPDSSFESLGIDSLDRLNILFDLESEFDIEIDDEDAKQVTGIQQMIEGVTLLVDAKAAGVPAPHFPGTHPVSGAPRSPSPVANDAKPEPKAGE
jgi:acyl carrier protein